MQALGQAGRVRVRPCSPCAPMRGRSLTRRSPPARATRPAHAWPAGHRICPAPPCSEWSGEVRSVGACASVRVRASACVCMRARTHAHPVGHPCPAAPASMVSGSACAHLDGGLHQGQDGLLQRTHRSPPDPDPPGSGLYCLLLNPRACLNMYTFVPAHRPIDRRAHRWQTLLLGLSSDCCCCWPLEAAVPDGFMV